MRIIAGKWRGRKVTSALKNARPTMSKVRAALFSSLGQKVVGANFLDLFAGSGIMGLEAFSRGAAHVVFADVDKKATLALRALCNNWLSGDLNSDISINSNRDLGEDVSKETVASKQPIHDKNLFLAQEQAPLTVHTGSWERLIAKMLRNDNFFNIIYVDPPYFCYDKPSFIVQLYSKVFQTALLAPGGMLVLEQRKKISIPKFAGVHAKQKKYGSSQLVFFEKNSLA